jgi:hypothetical protein
MNKLLSLALYLLGIACTAMLASNSTKPLKWKVCTPSTFEHKANRRKTVPSSPDSSQRVSSSYTSEEHTDKCRVVSPTTYHSELKRRRLQQKINQRLYKTLVALVDAAIRPPEAKTSIIQVPRRIIINRNLHLNACPPQLPANDGKTVLTLFPTSACVQTAQYNATSGDNRAIALHMSSLAEDILHNKHNK